MIRESLRTAAYAVAPQYVVDTYLRRKMLSQARRLSELRDLDGKSQALIESLWGSHFFRPIQKKSEILRLRELVRNLRPSSICEIGAAGGGTTFLLAQAAERDATIITIDLAFTKSRRAAVSCFAMKGQKLFCLQENSQDPGTVLNVQNCLAGEKLDVLYLDADHSYEGIKTDFQLYSPLVGTGGMIVFHDIVPDYRTRFGLNTSSEVGGVPQFWQEIKSTHANVEEIVEDYEQDGFGIGVLHWN